MQQRFDNIDLDRIEDSAAQHELRGRDTRGDSLRIQFSDRLVIEQREALRHGEERVGISRRNRFHQARVRGIGPQSLTLFVLKRVQLLEDRFDRRSIGERTADIGKLHVALLIDDVRCRF